jgi:WD40 repeat protein
LKLSFDLVRLFPDSKRVALRHDDGTLRVWELDTGRLLSTDKLPAAEPPPGCRPGPAPCFSYSPDGRWVVDHSGRTLLIWDLRSGKLVRSVPPRTEELAADCEGIRMAWDADSRHLATVQGDTTVEVWDVAVLTKSR